MKKISVSTVRQTADVEVIYVNANLISKVIKANLAIDKIVAEAKAWDRIQPVMVAKLDQDGHPEVDPDTGCDVMEQVTDEKGNPIIEYSDMNLSPEHLRGIAENVATLLKELTDAFDA